MLSALYIGATGMKSLSEGMNVVSNNLANVSTIGYKQQNIQFSDLIYTEQGMTGNSWGAQEDSYVALGQLGKGVQIDTVRTIFTQGTVEDGSSITDMALVGDGFFQVTGLDGETMYTRAGNFRFDEQGFVTLPAGETLNGYAIDEQGNQGELGAIQIDPTSTIPGKATTTASLGFNLGEVEDSHGTASSTPYFNMVQAYDGTNQPPLSSLQYSYAQGVRIYDANGEAQTLNLYVDGTPDTDPNKIMEFMIASEATAENPEGQALLTGTMTFNSEGEIIDISTFSLSGGDSKDLANWVPSETQDGVPVLNYNGQSVAIDFGLRGGAVQGAAATAADVGTDSSLLGTVGTDISRVGTATTAYDGYNSMHSNIQDGYAEGQLTDIDITTDGTIVGYYSNEQIRDLYEIPVARFTSNDGLRREGGNMYTATADAGIMTLGQASSENFASIYSLKIEGSNVDMSTEMVNMIVTQRGFQSNSKVVTTADTMLQKAIELKRS